MRRREFLGVLGGAATWPVAARAQPAMPTIGFLSMRSAENDAKLVMAFRKGLSETGGTTTPAIDYRFAEGDRSRLTTLAAEFARRHATVIVAADGASALAAIHEAPGMAVVFFSGGDPVELGLVASLNRPGGTVTGVTVLGHSIIAKRLQLLREMVPLHEQIVYFSELNNPSARAEVAEVHDAAQAIGQKLRTLALKDSADFAGAFDDITRSNAKALVVGGGPLFTNNRLMLAGLAAQHRIPAIYNLREFVEAGGLASYGANIGEGFEQMGRYTRRILAGEKPADLPVTQPTRFELVINLKTAKALGLNVPPTLLAQADEVIE
jgi:putative tryptophan/tyrosine transport system substrate-binding protein